MVSIAAATICLRRAASVNVRSAGFGVCLERRAVVLWPVPGQASEDGTERPGVAIADIGGDAGDCPLSGLEQVFRLAHPFRLQVSERGLAGLGAEPPQERSRA